MSLPCSISFKIERYTVVNCAVVSLNIQFPLIRFYFVYLIFGNLIFKIAYSSQYSCVTNIGNCDSNDLFVVLCLQQVYIFFCFQYFFELGIDILVISSRWPKFIANLCYLTDFFSFSKGISLVVLWVCIGLSKMRTIQFNFKMCEKGM